MNYTGVGIDEFCKLLIISRKSAYSLLNSGKLKGFKIGSKWKIPHESITEFIKQQTKVAADELLS